MKYIYKNFILVSIMRKISFLLLLFILPEILLSNKQYAFVTLDFEDEKKREIPEELFGNFIEYYMSFRNGKLSIWAQDIQDRGFDMKQEWRNTAQYWYKYVRSASSDPVWEVLEGGYNKNAPYFQRVTKTGNDGYAGVKQNIYATEGAGYDFYVYLRGSQSIEEVKVRIIDVEKNDLISEYSLGKPEQDWQKHSVHISPLENCNYFALTICFTGEGSLDLDEASLIPDNNINGFRKGFYDNFKKWEPTILRYPGGWFVEYSAFRFEMGIGDIDQRPVYKGHEVDRLDFGYHEFIAFCREIGCKPHMVVPFLDSSPEESARFVEYFNGPATSEMGALRAKNGSEEPFDVKFWEIGNEVWFNAEEYGKGFAKHYKAMKEVDPTIECMISGDIWSGDEYVDTIMTEVGENCDYYGWHWAQPLSEDPDATDEQRYLCAVAGNLSMEDNVDYIQSWINKKGLAGTMKQTITEVWTSYAIKDWDPDTTLLGGSLQNGLWMAGQLNSAIRMSDLVKIFEKTYSVHTFRLEIDSENRKVYYATPTYHALQMYTQHHGEIHLPAYVNCGEYDTPNIKGHLWNSDVPWLDVIATSSEDSLFIHVLNRHPEDTIETHFNFNFVSNDSKVKEYLLYSDHYLDVNTVEQPNYIQLQEKEVPFSKSYDFLPHSFTILAMNLDDITSVASDKAEKEFSVYPNPCYDRAFLNIQGSSVC